MPYVGRERQLPSCNSTNRLQMDVSVWFGLPINRAVSWLANALCQYVDHEFVFERLRKTVTAKYSCLDGDGRCRMAQFKRSGDTGICLDSIAATIFTGAKSHRTDMATSETEEIKQPTISYH